MKFLSMISLFCLLIVSACSHHKKCCGSEAKTADHCSKEKCDKGAMKCSDGSCGKNTKCADGSCKKTCCENKEHKCKDGSCMKGGLCADGTCKKDCCKSDHKCDGGTCQKKS